MDTLVILGKIGTRRQTFRFSQRLGNRCHLLHNVNDPFLEFTMNEGAPRQDHHESTTKKDKDTAGHIVWYAVQVRNGTFHLVLVTLGNDTIKSKWVQRANCHSLTRSTCRIPRNHLEDEKDDVGLSQWCEVPYTNTEETALSKSWKS